MEKFEAKEVCKKHMYRYVRATMSDGSTHDGFVEHVDEEQVYLAVPVGHESMPYHHESMPYHHESMPYHHGNMPYHHGNVSPYHHGGCWDPCYRYAAQDTRAFFPYGYGFGFPYGGFPYRRRFNRLVLPLVGLTALSLLPFY
ncbi:hypothetical protein P4H66_24870 [Paenibacillus dokdonensis]|uniref:Uncharacterized protein n=1 Tax=Paenibacillus dokdonensis TaxID=2567944 RepID=A0ABU6GTH4_9BACL|nr:hypothetical protein [Paenibacillus dokdonensis]MEC0243047.1 hypothetical protein [Paenibacillus dokdonensis]